MSDEDFDAVKEIVTDLWKRSSTSASLVGHNRDIPDVMNVPSLLFL